MRRFDTVTEARAYMALMEQKGYETSLAQDIGRDGKPVYTAITRRVA